MPFLLSRRVWFFLLLDAVILLGLMGVFAAVNHAFVPNQPPALSERILATPSPSTISAVKPPVDSPGKSKPALAVIPNKIQINPVPSASGSYAYLEAAPTDTFDLSRLICKKIKVLTHKVEMKENYWTIAKNNRIDILTLIGANPGLPFKARIHQVLDILPRKGVLHTVAKDENISQIALEYRTDEKILKAENGISWWHSLHPGDVLFIPDVKPILMTKEWHDYFGRRGIFGDPLGRWGKINSPFATRTDPLTGEIRHHNGVDLKAKYGDPVYAAGSGKVSFTGISGGYGNLITISHGKGLITYYGHLSKIYAKTGQKVRKGTLIGRVGATGRVTGPHLHFEVRKNGKPLDPLLYI
jgi:hypothetical protein